MQVVLVMTARKVIEAEDSDCEGEEESEEGSAHEDDEEVREDYETEDATGACEDENESEKSSGDEHSHVKGKKVTKE